MRRVSARVYGDDGGLGPPFDHLALVVRLPDRTGPWLADVGFGSHSTYPLLADARAGQADPGGRFLLAGTPDGDIDVIKDDQPQYRFEVRERALDDFVPTCWWQQACPPVSRDGPATRCRLAASREPVGLVPPLDAP